MSAAPVEETLAWEAQHRPRAATAAITAGALGVAGNILLTTVSAGGPTEDDEFISLGESVSAHLDGRSPQGDSLALASADYLGDHVALLSLSSVLTAIAFACLALTLLFLYRATYARSQQIGRLPYYAALAGLFLAPVGHLLWQLPVWFGASGITTDADRTPADARDALAPDVSGFGQLIEQVGILPLALAVILISLNAMRAGLLTRFLGILGMLTGVFLVIGQQLDPPGIIRGFWLIGTGLIIAGRIRVPPAWQTGRAEPWPSQQQLREQREAAAGGGAKDRAPREPKPPRPAADEAEPGAQPQRKKRKRRR